MKNKSNFKWNYLLFVFLLGIIALSCNKDEEEINGPSIASDINTFIEELPDWTDQTDPENWDSLIGPIELQGDDKIPTTCDVYKRAITIPIEDIIAVETNFGKIWPGALVEGNSLEGGDLKLINIPRNGITINTNLPINQTFREVDDPNSVSVQQAIAEMQIESGLMPDGIEAGAGIMETRIEEYSTYLQAMISMGISGGFTEPESHIKLDGEVNGSIGFELNTHSVIVKFVQNAFTVRLADDLIESPSDFFANTVTMDDIQKLESNGTLNSENVPLYIESVTYGRFLLFTLTSTTVETYQELNAAVNASWDNYVSAGGGIDEKSEAILSSKTTKIFSAGGSEEAANAAVASLDWSKFFVKAPVTTAVPISFVARTMNGKKKVVLIDKAIYNQRGDCSSPEKIKMKIEITNVVLENPKLGVTEYGAATFRNSQQVGDVLESGEFITNPWTTDKVVLFGKGEQTYTWNISESSPETDKLMIRSANKLVHWNEFINYPFAEFNEGAQNRFYYSTNNIGEKMRFRYRITKTFE